MEAFLETLAPAPVHAGSLFTNCLSLASTSVMILDTLGQEFLNITADSLAKDKGAPDTGPKNQDSGVDNETRLADHHQREIEDINPSQHSRRLSGSTAASEVSTAARLNQ